MTTATMPGPDATHAHYLTSLRAMAKSEEDDRWIAEHAARYIEQHSVFSGQRDGLQIHVLDDRSAVAEREDGGFEHYHYDRDRFRNIGWGPTPEQRAQWQYETFTSQDYAGILDLTTELRETLRERAAAYQPGAKARQDFLDTLDLVEAAHRRIEHRHGTPVSVWIGWIRNRRSWLDDKLPLLNEPGLHEQEKAHITDVSIMLAAAPTVGA